MTVEELIEELRRMPPYRDVYIATKNDVRRIVGLEDSGAVKGLLATAPRVLIHSKRGQGL